jgi:hypothetical protein
MGRQGLRGWVGMGMAVLLAAAGCRPGAKGSVALAKGPRPGTEFLEFVVDPEGCQFVATVQFDRMDVQPAAQDPDGSISAYYTEMKPVRLIDGRWDLNKVVTVKSAHYLATAPETQWIGILVKDPAKKTRWFSEFILRNGRLYEGGTEEFVGAEKDAAKVIQTYLRENGIRFGGEHASK